MHAYQHRLFLFFLAFLTCPADVFKDFCNDVQLQTSSEHRTGFCDEKAGGQEVRGSRGWGVGGPDWAKWVRCDIGQAEYEMVVNHIHSSTYNNSVQ